MFEIDLLAELLDDDETTPKPKPSTAAPQVAQVLDETPEEQALDDEEEFEEDIQPQITIQKVPEPKPTPKPTKAPKKPKSTKTTTLAPVKSDLPPLNLQNTPALLELQAQLTANNNVKGGDLSDEEDDEEDEIIVTTPTPKPTKTQKKKKTQKGQLKKQTAIETNEIGQSPVEKTLLNDATKPQNVIIEDSVVMEKVPLKTPESEKLKKQQQQQSVDEYVDEENEHEIETESA